jgi:hypothetical protein
MNDRRADGAQPGKTDFQRLGHRCANPVRFKNEWRDSGRFVNALRQRRAPMPGQGSIVGGKLPAQSTPAPARLVDL